MVRTFNLKNGKTVKVTAKNKRVAKRFHNADHYAYTITIEVSGSDLLLKTAYHDSIYNYSRGKGATQEMIANAVYCTIMDADSYRNTYNYADFLNEYGYEDDKNGRRVYNACKETYDGLYAMLSEEEVDELYDMVES